MKLLFPRYTNRVHIVALSQWAEWGGAFCQRSVKASGKTLINKLWLLYSRYCSLEVVHVCSLVHKHRKLNTNSHWLLLALLHETRADIYIAYFTSEYVQRVCRYAH
jgi:hypothetical protein